MAGSGGSCPLASATCSTAASSSSSSTSPPRGAEHATAVQALRSSRPPRGLPGRSKDASRGARQVGDPRVRAHADRERRPRYLDPHAHELQYPPPGAARSGPLCGFGTPRVERRSLGAPVDGKPIKLYVTRRKTLKAAILGTHYIYSTRESWVVNLFNDGSGERDRGRHPAARPPDVRGRSSEADDGAVHEGPRGWLAEDIARTLEALFGYPETHTQALLVRLADRRPDPRKRREPLPASTRPVSPT